MSRRSGWSFAAVLLSPVLLSVIISWWLWVRILDRRARWLAQNGPRTTGHVRGREIEFVGPDGVMRRATPFVHEAFFRHPSNTEVTVAYDPLDPSRFIAPRDGSALSDRTFRLRLLGSSLPVVGTIAFVLVALRSALFGRSA